LVVTDLSQRTRLSNHEVVLVHTVSFRGILIAGFMPSSGFHADSYSF